MNTNNLMLAQIPPVLNIPSGKLVVAALFFTLCAAIWSAAQSAFVNLTNARAQDLVEDQRKGAKTVRRLVEDREWVVDVCQTGRVSGQVLATSCLTLALIGWHFRWWAALLVGCFLSATVLLSVCTMMAARIGRSWPELTALRLSGLVAFAAKLLAVGRPVATKLNRTTNPTDAQARLEVAEDLREMVEEMGEDENLNLEEEDRQILRSVFELGTTLVREVIVPRTEMVTVETNQPVRQALEDFIRSGYSRLPVIGEDSDDIRGVVYLKDVVARIINRPELLDHPVHEMMREAYFVPEMMLADNLLRAMQGQAPHIALVVDEWGGIVGLVTIEDVLEELVGEMTDEHDHATAEPEQIGPQTWRIPAKLPLDDLGELVDLEIDDDDVDTAGGLLTKALGKVPLVGSEASTQGVHLKVQTVQGRRRQMAWLEVTKLATDLAEPEE